MTSEVNSHRRDMEIFMAWKQQLVEGYHRFRASHYPEQKSLYERLGKHGQSPKVMLVSCCDSRADPSDIFDAAPGEMFVLRNVANLVPPKQDDLKYHSVHSAVEFAVDYLKVEAIVVMGHESCGGINACLAGAGDDTNNYIGRWISLLNGARDRVRGRANETDMQQEMEFEGVRESLSNLMMFDGIREKVEAGELHLLGAYFSIIRGKLLFLNENDEFEEVPAQ
ncbi:carbonic anhydrase [Robiginitomaculum antarcticum]|uniref:carbonic anhydrase n=1 Tax=Robiginitomaculum antarcticum TaxID=437507 RepID=UPI00036D802B|nr:carbonic anhydrase [Robiginitomaculum antarcticum]